MISKNANKFFPIFCFIVLTLSFLNSAVAQVNRETRAVWVATNFRLDWPPPTFDQQKQKESLKEILDNIKSKNLNTIYFQVRSNGTVLFKSSFELLSPYITGTIGVKANYDPLQFAIEEAHKRGLEIHAWINTIRCFTGNELSILNNPNHIAQRKPEWVVEDFRDGVKSYWLDPGLPEVRNYLSDLIEEMVANYNVDGVQLDFIRYPGKNFDDDFSYNIYANGQNREDWRRNNITSLIELISKKAKAKKPFVKIGATPIGVFRNLSGMYGWEGFAEVYQDSRVWLKRELLDYVAPQIYWAFNDNTRFDLLAKEWVENSFGRNVVLGIGAFKENVKPEIEKMIRYSREIGANGVAFFRYTDIAGIQFQNFTHKALPSSMDWLEAIYPEPPEKFNASISNSSKSKIDFNWQSKSEMEDDSISYFALYSLPHPAAELLPDYLIDVIPANQTSYSLSIEKPNRINYYFTLKSVSRTWNESVEASNIASIKINELTSFIYRNEFDNRPILLKDNFSRSNLLIYSNNDEKIEVIRTSNNSEVKIGEFELLPGKNIFELSINLQGISKIKIFYRTSGKEFDLKF